MSLYISWKEKRPDVGIYNDLWTVAAGQVVQLEICEEVNLKLSEKDILETGI